MHILPANSSLRQLLEFFFLKNIRGTQKSAFSLHYSSAVVPTYSDGVRSFSGSFSFRICERRSCTGSNTFLEPLFVRFR